MSGPDDEDTWAQQKEWDEEARLEYESRLSKEDIYDIKSDEEYDNNR